MRGSDRLCKERRMIGRYMKKIITSFLMALFIAGCGSAQNMTPVPAAIPSPTATLTPPASAVQPTPSSLDMSEYAFPASVDPTKRYLFYLHGKIIEDQGIPAISPDYGEYEYQAILEKLRGYGFVVISEQRAKDTDSTEYARRVSEQVKALLDAGVPPDHITVVGASKGAGITILASHLLQNEKLNFVIMAICDPATIAELKQDGTSLYGNVLSIYDSADNLAGSCQELFSFSKDKGLARSDEILLHVGTGHGVLFKPLDEWILPVIYWAGNP
jgi:hypothetical protein